MNPDIAGMIMMSGGGGGDIVNIFDLYKQQEIIADVPLIDNYHVKFARFKPKCELYDTSTFKSWSWYADNNGNYTTYIKSMSHGYCALIPSLWFDEILVDIRINIASFVLGNSVYSETYSLNSSKSDTYLYHKFSGSNVSFGTPKTTMPTKNTFSYDIDIPVTYYDHQITYKEDGSIYNEVSRTLTSSYSYKFYVVSSSAYNNGIFYNLSAEIYINYVKNLYDKVIESFNN